MADGVGSLVSADRVGSPVSALSLVEAPGDTEYEKEWSTIVDGFSRRGLPAPDVQWWASVWSPPGHDRPRTAAENSAIAGSPSSPATVRHLGGAAVLGGRSLAAGSKPARAQRTALTSRQGAIILLDFKAAFPSLGHNYIKGMLEALCKDVSIKRAPRQSKVGRTCAVHSVPPNSTHKDWELASGLKP